MMEYCRKSKIHLLLSVLLTGTLPSAFAQEEEEGARRQGAIEEIIVTARKKEERLLDIPGSVTALTEDRLRDLGIRTVDDVARFTPGFSFSKAFGRSTERPVIRGAANILAGTTPLAESGASYYLNGVYFQGDVQSLDMNLVERVEVLKGPQSSAYGRNAYSGAVNFVLKDLVGGEFEADVNASLGLAGDAGERREVSASARIPVNDNLGFSIGVRQWEYDGEYENRTVDTTIGDEETTSLSLGLQFSAGRHEVRAQFLDSQDADGTRALFLHRSDYNNCFPGYRSNLTKSNFGVNAVRHGTEIPGGRRADNPFQYFCGEVKPQDVVRLNTGNTVDPVPPVGTDPNVHPNAYDSTVAFSGVERDRQIYMLQYAFEGEAVNVNANLAVREEVLTTGSDSDHWDLRWYTSALGATPETPDFPQRSAGFAIAFDDVFEDTSFEVRLTSDQSRAFRWGVGYFRYDWRREANFLDWQYDLNSITATRVVRDDPATTGNLNRACTSAILNDCTSSLTVTSRDVTELGIGRDRNTDSYTIENRAVFGNVELDFGPSTLSFEVREATEIKSLRDEGLTALVTVVDITETPTTAGTAVTTTDGTVEVVTTTGEVYARADQAITVSKDDDEEFGSFTWKLSYSLDLSDNSLFYASLATGNKPGGLNSALAEVNGFPDFDEEESLNYEVGFKGTFAGGSIYMAGSVYYKDIKKFQLTSPYEGAIVSAAVSNQGDAEITGLEYEFRGFFGNYFDVGFSLALTEPEITKGCDIFEYVLTSGGFQFPNFAADGSQNPDPAGALSGATCDISGKQLPLTSEVQWSADLNFNYPLTAGLSLTAGINANFESSKYAQVHNRIETGDALEVGVYVGVYGDQWSLRLTGRNINDEDAPLAVTRWADYGQGSSCAFFAGFLGPAACKSELTGNNGGVTQAVIDAYSLTDEQVAVLNDIGTSNPFVRGLDFGSPRAPFVSLRTGSTWILTFSYNF